MINLWFLRDRAVCAAIGHDLDPFTPLGEPGDCFRCGRRFPEWPRSDLGFWLTFYDLRARLRGVAPWLFREGPPPPF